MKKKILGIAALVAVIGQAFVFSTCQLPLDEDVRTVTFYNQTSVDITINCQADNVNSFKLTKAKTQLDEEQYKTLTRKGKDIIINSITVGQQMGAAGDEWDYIEVKGSAVGGTQKKGQSGLALKFGDIYFVPAKGKDPNPAGTWKVTAIPQDE